MFLKSWFYDHVMIIFFYTAARIKGRGTNFGGGQDWRERIGDNFSVFFRTGDNFLVKTLGENWTGDKFLSEKMDGRRKNIWWTGDPEISPVVLYGRGCSQVSLFISIRTYYFNHIFLILF